MQEESEGIRLNKYLSEIGTLFTPSRGSFD